MSDWACTHCTAGFGDRFKEHSTGLVSEANQAYKPLTTLSVSSKLEVL